MRELKATLSQDPLNAELLSLPGNFLYESATKSYKRVPKNASVVARQNAEMLSTVFEGGDERYVSLARSLARRSKETRVALMEFDPDQAVFGTSSYHPEYGETRNASRRDRVITRRRLKDAAVAVCCSASLVEAVLAP